MKGNTTRAAIEKALAGMRGAEDLLRFDLRFEESGSVDEETGEVLMRVSSDYLREPLYRLWHTLYSISDRDELGKVLAEKFGIADAAVADNLFRLNFREAGYGNKSAKFMCKLIPYMEREGLCYADACERVGTRHSESLTKGENDSRELLALIPQLKKGELRQPVVEKILNQTISLVNAAISEFGSFDEIHVELARELKRSADERSSDYERNNKREKENKACIEAIVELGLRPSANRVRKYRMWKESEQVCMYCGQPVGVKDFLLGIDAEKEHVIPRSIFFDDSFSNKVCACRKCNHDKGQATGYDFMAAQGEEKLQQYIDRVEKLHEMYKSSKGERGISKTKHDRLLTSRENIPQDFIARDLRLTQYIARKAMEILRQVCRDVFPTTGAVTDFFRHAWGYDEILHNINRPRYSEAGQTDMIERNNRKEERIEGWNKRLDHRHHAIDALTIALTRHSHVQRLNTLNAGGAELGNLDKWAAAQPHFSVAAVADAARRTAVSFRAGKRVSTPSRRYIRRGGKRVLVQDGLFTPKGALTEESVYGINRTRLHACPLKSMFAAPALICDEQVRKAVELRLAECAYDVKAAVKSCKKSPLTLQGTKTVVEVCDMWKEDYVIRYNVESITYKNINDVVDNAIRSIIADRFAEVGNNDKAFQKSLAERPLLSPGGQPVRKVRCLTGLKPDSMTVVRRSDDGNPIGFSKYGNNHHVALYIAPDGSLEESIVPFAVAVERRRLGLPVVVTNPEALWDTINNRRDELPDELLSRFPLPDRKFLTSMQVNEMFIIGLSDDEINTAIAAGRTELLTEHLYMVQRLSSGDYIFRRHTCTIADTTKEQTANKNYIRIQSADKYKELNPIKVTVDRLGRIHRQI